METVIGSGGMDGLVEARVYDTRHTSLPRELTFEDGGFMEVVRRGAKLAKWLGSEEYIRGSPARLLGGAERPLPWRRASEKRRAPEESTY